MESLHRREYGDQDGKDKQGVARPDRENLYYLNGEAYGVKRGTTEAYYITFGLVRDVDGEEIFSQQYEVKYSKE